MKHSDFSKNANMLDVIWVVAALFLVGFVGIVAYDIFNDINQDIQNDDSFDSDTKQKISSLNNRFPSYVDGLFAVVFFGLWLTVLVLSFVLGNDSIFLWVSIMLLIVVLVLAVIFGNVYSEFVATDAFSGYETSFPILNFVLSHVLEMVLVVSSSVMVVLYAKNKFQ